MSQIAVSYPNETVADTSKDYRLRLIGRTPDRTTPKASVTEFVWNDVPDTETYEFQSMLEDMGVVVREGFFNQVKPDALCAVLGKKHLSLLDIVPKGDAAPVVETVEPEPEPEPEARVNAKAAAAELRATIKDDSSDHKPRYTLNFLGWCNESGHDKIWGYVTVGDHCYNFWGARGKKLSFQEHKAGRWGDNRELRSKAEAKCRPRANGAYHEIALNKVESVVPDFFNQLEHQLTIAKLFDNFRHKPLDE